MLPGTFNLMLAMAKKRAKRGRSRHLSCEGHWVFCCLSCSFLDVTPTSTWLLR